MREEDDELLRAAEELGIDLSPAAVRAAAADPSAQELEEGADVAGDGADLLVANDEGIGDLDEDETSDEADEDELELDIEVEVEVED